MKFEPWTMAYDKLNKKLERIYPQFQELHMQLKKGGILIAFKAYVAFMVLLSTIVFVASIALSLTFLPILNWKNRINSYSDIISKSRQS